MVYIKVAGLQVSDSLRGTMASLRGTMAAR